MNNIDFQNGFALGRATGGVVEVIDTTEIDNLENLIDESGVAEDMPTLIKQVEFLINQAELLKEARLLKFEGSKNITKAYLDCANLTSLQSMFQNAPNVKEVYLKNTKNIRVWQYAFYCPAITIETLDFSSATGLGNYWCSSDNLKNIKIVPNTIKVSLWCNFRLLTAESVKSIVDGLATLEEGATAQTIVLNSALDDGVRLTDELKAVIAEKRWTLSLY